MRRVPSTLVLSLAVVAVAAGLLLGLVQDLPQPDRGFHLPWLVLAGLFGVSVVLRVHLLRGRQLAAPADRARRVPAAPAR